MRLMNARCHTYERSWVTYMDEYICECMSHIWMIEDCATWRNPHSFFYFFSCKWDSWMNEVTRMNDHESHVWMRLCHTRDWSMSLTWMVNWMGLQHTATRCNTLHHAATHCNTLQPYEKGYFPQERLIYSTLQHTATHCNTMQHTATHWNTLQHNEAQW